MSDRAEETERGSPPVRSCLARAEGMGPWWLNSSFVRGLVDTVALSIRGIAEWRAWHSESVTKATPVEGPVPALPGSQVFQG